MIIDAHNHADWCGHDFDRFIQNMDQYHIDKAWVLSWEAPFGEYCPISYDASCTGGIFTRGINNVPVPFERCLEYKRRAPDRFVLGYAPDPRRFDAVSALKGAVDTFGVQVCGEVKFRMMYNNPDALDLFAFCGDAGLPVTLHYDYPLCQPSVTRYPRKHWWYGGGIETLVDMLEKCPKTNFLGHAPGFWGHISGDDLAKTVAYPDGPVLPGGRIEQLLEKYPNMYCDISAGSGCRALSRDLDYSYRLINRFPDRFVYARDYFDNQHQELIERLELPADVKALVLGGNAERLVRPL